MSDASNGGSMRVSIIIATYGDEEWLTIGERARLSAQVAGRPLVDEIIVYHGSATIAKSRNWAASFAVKDWLCFLDADDELAPGYLDAMQRAYEREGGGSLLLTPAVQRLRKNGSVQGPPTFFDRGIPLTQDNWLIVGTLIQRDLFMRVGGFGDFPHGFEDWSLWYKAEKAGARIVKVPDAVYRYWVNPQSKHKIAWRNRREQVATHQRIAAELAAWTP